MVLELNERLEAVVAVKSRQPSGAFHGKVDFSQPPWSGAVATLVLDLHAEARELEALLRLSLNLRPRERGGSSHNTHLALEAVAALSEAADDHAVRSAKVKLNSWIRRARVVLGETELPKRLPRSPGSPEPKCPFCKYQTLRMRPGEGEIRCVNPGCADDEGRKPVGRMVYSDIAADWIILWQDNIAGVPV